MTVRSIKLRNGEFTILDRRLYRGRVTLWHKGFLLEGDQQKFRMTIYAEKLEGVNGVSCDIADINKNFPCNGSIRARRGYILCPNNIFCLFIAENVFGPVGLYVIPVLQAGHKRPFLSQFPESEGKSLLAIRQRDCARSCGLIRKTMGRYKRTSFVL
eukprot:Lankesteria_metandrocarpae@DN2712_c0_g1_i2.p1